MVLNSTHSIPPLDAQHAPYRYFNQDNFFNAFVKNIITVEEVQKKGMTLTELSQVMQNYGLKANPFFANTLNLQEFREILKNALLKQQFI